MMTVSREEFDALLSAFEAERIKNSRFRREIEDIIAHLDTNNMPEIAERIRGLEKDRLVFTGGTADGPIRQKATYTGGGIVLAESNYGTLDQAMLLPNALQLTALRNPRTRGEEDLPLYVDRNGYVVSCTE